MPPPSPRSRLTQTLARHWTGRLAPYRRHRHDEHREALIEEALRFTGLQLEGSLAQSDYWSEAPLARRAAVLLYLVDRSVVARRIEAGRAVYEASPSAEEWVASEPTILPYLAPMFELLAALREAQARRLLMVD